MNTSKNADMIDFNFFNQTHTCSKQMKSECARDKKNKICCYAHASGGDRTRAIDVTMWCHLFNIFSDLILGGKTQHASYQNLKPFVF